LRALSPQFQCSNYETLVKVEALEVKLDDFIGRSVVPDTVLT